ncbi:MAG TPA: FAD-binding oxidoreductase [Candidatus Binatia bacterium]|nr:FAD-binding oxidoreductase [Candidatus Binatia bacterium]
MRDVKSATIERTAVNELAETVSGHVIRPGDEAYESARSVWNGMIDRRPALIVGCANAADIVASLAFAREHGLAVTVRGGGHSVAGRSIADDALLIDLSSMNQVEVDPDARIARVGPGAVGADLDSATQEHGLATTGGTYSATGVIGLTLGGGMGFLARRFGMAVDNVMSADVVLADGSQVHASETEHPDLFWALRGGGGNFGVVTSMELRLHPVGPELAVAQAFYPWTEASDVLRRFREFAEGAPDEVGCYALAVNVPPIPDFPEESHGTTAAALVASHAGPVADGERTLKPLTEMGSPLLAAVVPMPYATLQQSFDAAIPAHERYYWKSAYLSGIPDEAIDTFVAHASPLPGPFSSAYFETMGGAVSRVDPAATAFPHRDAPFNLGINPGWADADADEAAIAWAREFDDAMSPYSTGGLYANYAGQDDLDRLRAAYGGNLERLITVKDRYDPEQVFGRFEMAQ